MLVRVACVRTGCTGAHSQVPVWLNQLPAQLLWRSPSKSSCCAPALRVLQ